MGRERWLEKCLQELVEAIEGEPFVSVENPDGYAAFYHAKVALHPERYRDDHPAIAEMIDGITEATVQS